MFDGTINLDGAAGAESTFKLISQTNGESTRIDVNTTLAEPKLFVIKHTTTGKGTAVVDRHLVQFTATRNDLNGLAKVAVVNVTIAIPRTHITAADVRDLVAHAIDFLSDGGFSGSGLAGSAAINSLMIGEN